MAAIRVGAGRTVDEEAEEEADERQHLGQIDEEAGDEAGRADAGQGVEDAPGVVADRDEGGEQHHHEAGEAAELEQVGGQDRQDHEACQPDLALKTHIQGRHRQKRGEQDRPQGPVARQHVLRRLGDLRGEPGPAVRASRRLSHAHLLTCSCDRLGAKADRARVAVIFDTVRPGSAVVAFLVPNDCDHARIVCPIAWDNVPVGKTGRTQRRTLRPHPAHGRYGRRRGRRSCAGAAPAPSPAHRPAWS